MSQHDYLISSFPDPSNVSLAVLIRDIEASSISKALDKNLTVIDDFGDPSEPTFRATFKEAISGAEESVLDGLVSSHNASSWIPGPIPVAEANAPATDEDGIMLAKPKASGFNFIMCDRDIKIVTGTRIQSEAVEDLRYNPSDHSRSDWGECTLVGVFKSSGDPHSPLAPVASDAEAGTLGICTVVDYLARNQNSVSSPKDPVRYEIRGGALWVSPSLVNPWEHQIYAVAAPMIPSNLGGHLTFFDGYLEASSGSVVQAFSSDAFRLDPNGPAGEEGAKVRVAVFYPQGSQVTHVLRLVTYREPGTF